MDALLFANLTKNTLSDSFTGGAFAFPKLVGGDTIRIKLRLTTSQGQQILDASRRVVDSIKCSIGLQQEAPTSGAFALKLVAGAEVVGDNTTTALAHDISAANLAAALNALTNAALSAKKPFVVSEHDGSFFIRAADRSVVAWSVADNELWPSSRAHIASRDFDDGYGYELRLIQAPVAQTATYEEIVPELPSLTQEQAGATNSGLKLPEIQRLYIPPDSPAGYAFVLKRGNRRTQPIVIGSNDDAESLAELLNTKASTDLTETGFIDEGEIFRTYATENGFLIEFAGTMNGTDQSLLEVESVSEPEPDLVVTLDTETPAMATLLRRVNTTTKEIAAALNLTIVVEDEQDDSLLHTHTFHVPLTLVAPVNMEALSAAADINWAQPRSREDYLQHTPDQILTGQRHYIDDTVGDGSATDITITHNLGTRYIHVDVQETAADGEFIIMGTDYDVQIVSDNAIKLSFASAPALNAYRVQITSAAHDANYQAHTHAIDEVVGLEARLAAAEAAIASLQALAGTGSLGTTSAASGSLVAQWEFRPFLESYPPARDLAAMANAPSAAAATAATSEAAQAITLATLPLATLPPDGALLPAVHDHIPGSVAGILSSGALPAASGAHEGKVYVNDHSALVAIPGVGGVRGEKLRIGEHVACAKVRNITGAEKWAWFKVARAEGEGTWYPSAFERELFLIAVSASQLLEKRALKIEAQIEVAVLSRDLAMLAEYQRTSFQNTLLQWQLVIEWGARTSASEATGGTFTSTHGTNTLSATKHGMSDGQRVKLSTEGVLPAGLAAGTAYYVRDAAANTFKVAATEGGAAIEITDDGSGTHSFTPQTAAANLAGITWHATPVLAETIHVTRDPATIKFGCKVDRTAADAWVSYKSLNGISTAAGSTPTSSEFFVRARLCRFDTQDGMIHPVGLACLRFAEGKAEVR